MQRYRWRLWILTGLAFVAGGVGAQTADSHPPIASAPAAAASVAAASPQALPAAAFYRPDDIERMTLSPSGRWLALVANIAGGRAGLVVFDLQAWKPHGQPVQFADADIHTVYWVNDDRLVFNILDRSRGSGDQRWWPGLFSVGRDGKDLRQLVQLNKVMLTRDRNVTREPLEFNHELLHVMDDGGDEVIVGEWRWDGTGNFDGVLAKRLNVVTGRAVSLSYGAPAHVYRWLFDARGEPRAVVTRFRGREAIHWRAPGQDAWQRLVEGEAYHMPFKVHSIDSQGGLYVTQVDRDAGVAVLKRFDFASGRPEAEPLVRARGFDFWGGIVSETQGSRALGVRLTTDAESTVWFDARLAALQERADRRLPGLVNRIDCSRCDAPDMVVIVRSFSDREPGQFWLWRPATDEWRLIGRRRKDIEPRLMGTTAFERIKARDGLEIPVWVTRPAAAPAGPLPTVVLVHGGPWVRGRQWAWSADAQFLASRGYLVIEPEFRSSKGYGFRLYRAGWHQWGRAMQDDVADALAWAVAQGQADPRRACIAGASYGGYATLMGLARDADLYRCGVAWIAVSDPRLMFRWTYGTDQSDEVREVDLPILIGDPVKDAAMLDSVTPVLLAERIKAPLLLAYGGADHRVPLVHGERMRAALVAAGRPPEWVLYDDEGHGWLKLQTRLDFARRLEDFLARQLK